MGPLESSQTIDLLRTVLVVVAGLWVFFLYRKRRQGRAVMRSALWCRIGTGPTGERCLFVRLHAANVSSVVLRRVEATLILLVPSRLDKGQLWFTVVNADNPLVPVTREVQTKSGALAFATDIGPDMEPDECIESETVFPLSAPMPTLIALRCLLIGTEGSVHRRKIEWTTFAFLAPEHLTERYSAITCHARDLHEVHSPS